MSAEFKEEVLEQLRENGSDTSKPHNFEYFLYLPKQMYAEKAAAKIRESGFMVPDPTESASGGGWLCVARKTIIPDTADIGDHARFFGQIATALGGEFDGWEAEIV